MLNIRSIVIFFELLLFILFLSGCGSTGKSIKNNEVNIEKKVEVQKTNVPVTSKKTEATQKNENISTKNESNIEAELKKPAGENKEKDNSGKNKEEKTISTQYKEKETNSILETIKNLEQCYKTGDFEKWKSLLTPAYQEKYNDPVFLKEHGWQAKDLESFFYFLIKTREENGIQSLPISRVEFVNPNKAYVYVLFKGKEFPKPQHTFIKIGNSWYKGLPDEGE